MRSVTARVRLPGSYAVPKPTARVSFLESGRCKDNRHQRRASTHWCLPKWRRLNILPATLLCRAGEPEWPCPDGQEKKLDEKPAHSQCLAVRGAKILTARPSWKEWPMREDNDADK